MGKSFWISPAAHYYEKKGGNLSLEGKDGTDNRRAAVGDVRRGFASPTSVPEKGKEGRLALHRERQPENLAGRGESFIPGGAGGPNKFLLRL